MSTAINPALHALVDALANSEAEADRLTTDLALLTDFLDRHPRLLVLTGALPRRTP